MLKRLTTLLAALMLLTFVVAGCGDDSDSSGGGDTAAETQGEDTTTDATDSTDTDATVESGDVEVPANLEEAVENCKKSIGNAAQLSDDAKGALQDTCEKAGSGDQEEIKDAAREVCETIVKDSIPEGSPGREAALSACASAGGQ